MGCDQYGQDNKIKTALDSLNTPSVKVSQFREMYFDFKLDKNRPIFRSIFFTKFGQYFYYEVNGQILSIQ